MADSSFPDTIAAIATPPGRGGVGILRLSGPAALAIVPSLVRLGRPLEPRRARFVPVLDFAVPDPSTAGPIDEAVITSFPAPRSYTGEDVVEIAAHGSPVVLEGLLTSALRHGARLAAPGEFTQRAFLAGRLDLTEAEAVRDLIAAHTLEQARAAAHQLGGALSRRVLPVKERLLHLIALLEAGMDFASGELDDVDVVSPEQIATAVEAIHLPLAELARTFGAGALLRSGASLALIGRPNAGKSSLFNRLLERPRAIVTAIPGTTRDTVEETWSLDGIPLRLVDTAGLRFGDERPYDEAEQLGIERSREALAQADLVLLIQDATQPVAPEEIRLAQELAGRPFLQVRNKIDLLPPRQASLTQVGHVGSELAGSLPDSPAGAQGVVPQPADPSGHAERSGLAAPAQPLAVSALTGEGLPDLRSAILRSLHAGGNPYETGALNNRRQQQAVQDALEALHAASRTNTHHLPHEILLLDLHRTLQALDSLTGTTTPDDILNRIFSTFCIGK